MTTEARESAKKRMMYSKGDDFYFLTYNLLVLGSELKCFSEDKVFVDHRKVAFLVGFVSNPWLTDLALRCKGPNTIPANVDRSELAKAYADGSARIHLMTRLLFASERKGLLTLYPGKRKHSIDFSINVASLPEGFLTNSIFEMEQENVSTLRKIMPQLRNSKLGSMLERLFVENGVQVWHD